MSSTRTLQRFLKTSAEAPQCQRDAEHMRHFMKELAAGNESLLRRQHAANAVSLYFQMLEEEASTLIGGETAPATGSVTSPESAVPPLCRQMLPTGLTAFLIIQRQAIR